MHDAQPAHNNCSARCPSQSIKQGTALQALSINATQSMEQVAAAGKDCPLLMMNIYIFRDRGFTSRLLRSMPLSMLELPHSLSLPAGVSSLCA